MGRPEGLALLRVPDRFLERALGHADRAGRHVDASDLDARHHLVEALALFASEEVLNRDREVVEDELRRFDALVAELLDVRGDLETGEGLLHDSSAPSRR